MKIIPDQPVVASPLKGYRPCVAVIVTNVAGITLLARRSVEKSWQYPQGGIEPGEKPVVACLRELQEETGLLPNQVSILGHTPHWLPYDRPAHVPPAPGKHGKGQVQAWFMLQLLDEYLDLEATLASSSHAEFDRLRWATPAEALNDIVDFKSAVYRATLHHFAHTTMANNELWANLDH